MCLLDSVDDSDGDGYMEGGEVRGVDWRRCQACKLWRQHFGSDRLSHLEQFPLRCCNCNHICRGKDTVAHLKNSCSCSIMGDFVTADGEAQNAERHRGVEAPQV